MKNKNEIEKIIHMKGTFEIRIPFSETIIGVENYRITTANIIVYQPVYENNGYIVDVYNSTDDKKVYSPHGEYQYIIPKNNTFCNYLIKDSTSDGVRVGEKFGNEIDHPYGWDDEMIRVLSELLEILI